MNFNLLFSVVSTLSFIIGFPTNLEERQDYFIFEGVNQSAYLFRENKTLILHLSCNSEYKIYNSTISKEPFRFSWNGFEVNGEKMNILKATNGKMKPLKFENFTFLSPIIDIFDIEFSVDPIYRDVAIVNYWYFLIMVLVVAAAFDSKPMIINFIKKYIKTLEDDYVEMDQGNDQDQRGENINHSSV